MSTKKPIEQAVEALEFVADGQFKVKWPNGDNEARNSCASHAEQALAALRASTGKIRDAAQWATDWEQRNYQKMAEWEGGGVATFVGFLQAVQADALAAAQPEPRPLRELIAEGHDLFWINATTMMEDGWMIYRRGLVAVDKLFSLNGHEHDIYSLLDCPAIPIPKPTVTL